MLPTDLLNLLELNSAVSSYCKRNVSKEGMFIPRIYTTSFGIQSLRYSAPLLWNNFLKSNCEFIIINKLDTFKSYLKDIFFKIIY